MGSREEPKGSTAMALPRYTVPGTHYKTSQRNFLIEAGLCRGQGAGWDAKERRHLWGSPRGGVSDDKVTHIWDFPASSAPGHRTPRLLRHRGRRLGFPCLPAPLHAIPRGGYPSLASHPRPLGGRGLCGASRCPPGKIGGMLALSSSPRGLSSYTGRLADTCYGSAPNHPVGEGLARPTPFSQRAASRAGKPAPLC